MTPQILPIAIAVFIVVAVFFAIWSRLVDRLVAVTLGAVAMIGVGIAFGFYHPGKAIASVNATLLCLLLDRGLLSAVLEDAGFFTLTANRMAAFTAHSAGRSMVVFCLLTYLASMFLNNLTAIMVVVPVTLRLLERLHLDPRPIVAAEVISSNLGAASCMIGDFPNMLISAEGGLTFTSFLWRMAPPCLVLLGLLFVLMRPAARAKLSAGLGWKDNDDKSRSRPKVIRRALIVLALEIGTYLFSDLLSIHSWIVSLVACAFLLIFCGASRLSVMKKVGFKDLAFFALLFVLVGGVHASGALDFVTDKIIMIAGDSKLLQCMVLMWLAAALTALLNAGPATALMLPILIDLRPGPPHHLLWWALSLGVCAGSSATLVGATAGPTAATIVERYFKTRAGAALKNLAFGEREYAYIGIPVCFVFLLVSSAYVLFVYVS